MSIVATGFSYYPDPSIGRPVVNGHIYVGVVDRDPTQHENQKQIYIRQEDGTEIPVAQPVRTGAGGIPMYGGSPCQILVSGDYSLTVQNEDEAQVYYVPNSFLLSDPFESSRQRVEYVDLVTGRLTYAVELPAAKASIYINGQGVDRGRLTLYEDYTANIDDNSITLFDSYPSNSSLTLTFNETGGESGSQDVMTPEEILEALLLVDGAGSLLDADFLDGMDSPEFVWMVNLIDTYTGISNEPLMTNSAGLIEIDLLDVDTLIPWARVITDFQGVGGDVVGVNDDGFVDSSLLKFDSFTYIGNWTPTTGNEYPATTPNLGDFWLVSGLGEGVFYTFETGDLIAQSVEDGNMMSYGKGGWNIIATTFDMSAYVLKSGDTMTGDLHLPTTPGSDSSAIPRAYADGRYLGIDAKASDSELLDGVEGSAYALLTNLAGYLPVGGTAANSELLDGHDSLYFATASALAGYLPVGATAADSELLDGHDSAYFASLAALDDYYPQSDFISVSLGSANAGDPIVLNGQGQIDMSMMNTSTFHYVGTFTPTAGDEYPDVAGETFGAFWVVQELVDPYTFVAGDLAGRLITNGDFMAWASDGWTIISGEMNPNLYYKLDGTQSLTAAFAAGGRQLKNVAAGTEDDDGVTLYQLENIGYLPAGAKAVDSNLLDGNDSAYYARYSDLAGYLPADGTAADSHLLDGIDSAGFLLVDGVAVDSALLESHPASYFATVTDLASYLPLTGKAADSELLDGLEAAAFLLVGGTAANSNLLDGQDSSVFALVTDLSAYLLVGGTAVNSDLLESHPADYFAKASDLSGYLPVGGIAADSQLLDGIDSAAFTLDSEFIAAYTGIASEPIMTDATGRIDHSLLHISAFVFGGVWTPTAPAEYPPEPLNPGDFWLVDGLGEGILYTFVGGDLIGQDVEDGNLMAYGVDGWGIVHSSVDPDAYVMKTGDTMTGELILPSTVGSDNTALPRIYADGRYLAIGGKAADSNLLDGHDSLYFALASDLDDYLPLNGQAADSKLLDGIDSTGFLLVAGTAANATLFAGHDVSYFALSSDLSGYLPIDGTAADSELLDGQEGAYYAPVSALAGYLPLTGGDLTGDLKLPATPEGDSSAITKGFADLTYQPVGGGDSPVLSIEVIDGITGGLEGVWTKPTVGTYIKVQMWGGGGAGGLATITGEACGGGGGEYTEWNFVLANMPATVDYTVGGGGAGISVDGRGGDGGRSLFDFDHRVEALGAKGGDDNRRGGDGAGFGGGTGGDMDVGGDSFQPGGGSGGGSYGENGGDSFLGGSGGAGGGVSSGAGRGGTSYGGGGAGGDGGDAYDNAADGILPAGGGGGAYRAPSGSGGHGRMIITIT